MAGALGMLPGNTPAFVLGPAGSLPRWATRRPRSQLSHSLPELISETLFPAGVSEQGVKIATRPWVQGWLRASLGAPGTGHLDVVVSVQHGLPAQWELGGSRAGAGPIRAE